MRGHVPDLRSACEALPALRQGGIRAGEGLPGGRVAVLAALGAVPVGAAIPLDYWEWHG